MSMSESLMYMIHQHRVYKASSMFLSLSFDAMRSII